MRKTQKHFFEWEPAVSPEQVFSKEARLNELQFDGDNLYWIEVRPSEKGRYAVVRMNKSGEIEDAVPQQFNARTRVHEYGGGSYAVFNGTVYFTNFNDQRLYKKSAGSLNIYPLTPAKNRDGSLGKYASLSVGPDGRYLLFVYEKEYSERENENFLSVLNLKAKGIAEPVIIARGHDFYADPIFSPDGKKIAWLQWDHPDMPWDSTELMMGDFKSGSVDEVKKVDGGKGISICFPKFAPDGRLYYVKDSRVKNPEMAENWWNIYRYDDKVERITSLKAEFGEPHWVFGQSRYDFLSDGRIIAKMLKDDKEYLIVINPETERMAPFETGLSSYRCIHTDRKNRVFFIGASSMKNSGIYSLTVGSYHILGINESPRIIKKPSGTKIKEQDISVAQPMEYPTKDGKKAHAFFYYPKNNRFSVSDGEKPPLLVIAHGGPTSRTSSFFSPVVQFWTSAGFAVVDVNYRGSTGYGRRYRDALLSRWGLIDTSDVADAIRYLIEKKMVSPDMVAIRGGSAGGYMVQRVMTEYPDLIRAGASYYGIGNLVTLTEQTHKFESRYIDNLVGEKFSVSGRRYRSRSPINHINRLKAPMIIFQGTDDKIVTPECSREVADALKKRGIKYEYVEYEGEAHGFRSKESNVDSLKREFAFYRKIF